MMMAHRMSLFVHARALIPVRMRLARLVSALVSFTWQRSRALASTSIYTQPVAAATTHLIVCAQQRLALVVQVCHDVHADVLSFAQRLARLL